MITVNGVQLRNLEEQVQKNKEDIAAHYAVDRVLANFGIKVIGRVNAVEDLPLDYAGEYGDAFAVGAEPPYSFYIWTRADPDAGHAEPYWFDVGELAIVGPQGVQGERGPQGPQGIRGTRWFSGSGRPIYTTGYEEYDYYINLSTGDIYHLHGDGNRLVWRVEGNIMGPQGPEGVRGATGERGEVGPQGPQGVPGPTGPAVELKGFITSIDQLPDPATVSPVSAYLQEIDGSKHVWGIVDGIWTDLGIFGGGTIVTVGGMIQNEWNADTKLDKLTSGAGRRVYGISASNSQTVYVLRPDITGASYQIAVREEEGQVNVPETPTKDSHAASKAYVDSTHPRLFACSMALSEYQIYFYTFSKNNVTNIGVVRRSVVYPCSGASYNGKKTVLSFTAFGNSEFELKIYDIEAGSVITEQVYQSPAEFTAEIIG